ncbi:MAG: hypothetical protein JRG97_15785 [Deltaproteobacteria bacterium]|nr:hypothetical protein [Deltaproteobacteria bacterium]MBW2053802.1 hypothetical protein [Deltaproteobacteria bacterium]MBW2142493.1 hypothetical protein [Deltaproteobacteria bacterium]MBW2324081.1 hypothetical protein [Deltaproteobacteria bacterium]
MARIKIKDLDPKINISKEEMKKVFGGVLSPMASKGRQRVTWPISYLGRRDNPLDGLRG